MYDGANWNLYRNGALLASAADTAGAGALLVQKANWAIGARGRWASMDVMSPVLDRAFQGRIDEAAIYNTALSAAQVLSHYVVGQNGLVLILDRSGSPSLTWPVGTLQHADTVNGSYTDVPSATSPYALPVGGAKYYRLRL